MCANQSRLQFCLLLAGGLEVDIEVWEIAPDEICMELHEKGVFHEGGQVSMVEVFDTGYLPLVNNLLGSFHLPSRIDLSLSYPNFRPLVNTPC